MRAAPALIKATIFWLIAAVVLLPACMAVGLVSGESLLIGGALAGALVPLVVIVLAPFSTAIKLFTLYALLNFAQMPFDQFKVEGMRGASAGNLFLLAALALWTVNFVERGRKTRPTPWDFWGPLAFFVVPACSVIYTASFDPPPGYSMLSNLMYLKNAGIPFFLAYLTTQLIEDRKELRLYFLVLVILCAIATVGSLPWALRNVGQIEEWQGSRTAGLLDSNINAWACMIAEITAYYFLLLTVVYRDRFGPAVVFLAILGGFAVSLIATMSRGGILGFGVALIVALAATRKAKGKVPWIMITGALVLGAVGLLQFAPDLTDGFVDRLGTERLHNPENRKSYDTEYYLNRYSGDRFELWRCAVMVWLENPLFGRGFGTAPYRIQLYHERGYSNSPHNVYTGALAQGGIIYLAVLLAFFAVTFRTFYRGYKASILRKDIMGVAICGGGAISLICVLVNGVTLDVLLIGERLYVIGFFWGVTASYCLGLEDEERARRAMPPRRRGSFPRAPLKES